MMGLAAASNLCQGPSDSTAHTSLCCCWVLQVLTFISSLFGDLIESIMKRDAGIKVCTATQQLPLCISVSAARSHSGDETKGAL